MLTNELCVCGWAISNTEISKHMLSMIFFFINYHIMNLSSCSHIWYFFFFCFSESVHDDTKGKVDNTIEHEDRHIEDFDGCVVCANCKVFIFFLDCLLVDRQSADATVILVNPSTKLVIQLICADQILFPSNVLQGLGS